MCLDVRPHERLLAAKREKKPGEKEKKNREKKGLV